MREVAKRRAWAWLGPALLACAPVGIAFAAEEQPQLPAEAYGDIPFALDAAWLLSPQGREEIYFSIAVPEEQLRCLEGEAEGEDHIELDLELQNLDASGAVSLARSRRLDVPCSRARQAARAATESPHRLLYLTAPWPGVGDFFELRLVDRNALRTGLVYHIQGDHRRGIVRTHLARPELRGGVGMSGMICLWDVQESAFGEGWRDDLLIGQADSARGAIDPNPRRAFGLRQNLLQAYAEIYGLAGSEVRLTRELLLLPGGERMDFRESRIEIPWDRTAIVQRFPIEELPAGTYDLQLTLTPSHADAAYRTGGHIQILWRTGFWNQTEADLQAEASLLLSEEQLERYARLEMGQREALVDSIWGDIDGLMEGELLEGPTRALFHERMAIADARFSARIRGSLSDRGRVFIRFGEPDEVQKELQPKEEDLIGTFLEREIDDAERSDTGGTMRRTRHDDSAYEVWYYTNQGEPLIPEHQPAAPGRSLKFIFADRLRTGEYRLIYSNVFGGLQ